MRTFKTPMDLLRAIDQLFWFHSIYPPRLTEFKKDRWEGDVSKDEVIFFKWDDGLVGIFYIDELYDTFERFAEDMPSMHKKFHRRNLPSEPEMIVPDRIFIL